RMNKFLVLLFVSAMVVYTFADSSSEESADDDLSKPALFIQRHLSNESSAVQADVIEGIRNFQEANITGFKNRYDKWPAHVQKLFSE
ncbi:hypothetical protein PENTCL1PPCAC_12024, partial [Pristionchus entomophagus]